MRLINFNSNIIEFKVKKMFLKCINLLYVVFFVVIVVNLSSHVALNCVNILYYNNATIGKNSSYFVLKIIFLCVRWLITHKSRDYNIKSNLTQRFTE